ncbi:kinesin-like protein KIF20A isoform X1 [Salmo salar]|uniref:Kinesin-like protein n=1 Tax=Salmo salar TaxID=8030 RepID=A0A1S3L1Z9_SALSA|nr:kinesin-like protein KIF20A isoform X1 [Salmo salar]XP_045546049.1 kinesin-like protein KIF20A isoform X1 [Salmo salar]|eukprot:XP_013984835.1 PREDICTED: kinesin-like protein KIF20A [Salmo salar]
MALSMASPCGVLSDEEEGGMAVFESTAADIGGLVGQRLNEVTLPEISIISPGLEPRPSIREKALAKPGVIRQGSGGEGNTDKVKVFLRIRPLTEGEKERGEDQGSVCVQNEESLMLKAPKDSQNMKSAERGVAQSMHKFSFSQIFGPETKQQDFFESTMKEMVRDVLRGESRLLYTYGVTNSGKTYTIQGVGREAGLLPRALVSLFRKLQGRLYGAMDLKPVLYQEVRQLDAGEVRAEEIRRDSLLKDEDGMTSRMRGGTSTWDSGIGGHSITSHIATQLEDSDSVCLEPDSLSHSGGEELEEGVQFSVWVSFYEIYNEFLYDLLEAPPCLQPKKRAILRLSDDKQGNPYVKDLTWVQVRSAVEAWRVLRAGRRNQSFASTHLNHNSSRSHSIFSTRILHVHPEANQGQATRVSELSVCDLAGSERCKDQHNEERMKEANNINTSLHTLGRCITALRHNQNNKSRPPQVVPFRDSKLTRVLQGFFCGRGRSSMVVNINPCASTYDETLQALKFSAIATQLVHGPSTKTRVAYILSLLREPQPHSNDSTLIEEDEDSDEDGDITMFDSDALLRAIEVLKREVQRQREEKEVLEATVREQVFSEMMEVISGMEKDFSQTLETEKALMEERFEDKINNLQKSLKRYYNQEIEERDEQIEALTAALEKKGGVSLAEPAPLPLFPPLAPGGEAEGPTPRRSQRLASTTTGELSRVRAELDQCRAELLEKTQELRRVQGQLTPPEHSDALTNAADRKLGEGQRNLRQLRLDLQRLGLNLQSGERACCRNTGGERLRHALTAADHTLAKQDQTLVELQNGLLLVKADLRRKAETLAQMGQMPPCGSASATPGSCQKRGCGAAGNAENQPPEKRHFFRSLFPQHTPSRSRQQGRPREPQTTPYSRILRSRQQSPPPSPGPSGRYRVTKC